MRYTEARDLIAEARQDDFDGRVRPQNVPGEVPSYMRPMKPNRWGVQVWQGSPGFGTRPTVLPGDPGPIGRPAGTNPVLRPNARPHNPYEPHVPDVWDTPYTVTGVKKTKRLKEQGMNYGKAREIIAEAIDRIHEGVVTAKGKGVLASRVNALRKRSDAVSQAANPHMIDEAILKGAGARRSVLLRKNREAREKEDRFKTQVRITGSPQTAALYAEPPAANPMARLRTRKTDKRGVEVSPKKKDFSAAQKAVAAGEKDAGEILDVIHRKPEGTRIKVFGKGPRGTDKSIHLHRKTELGKHRYFHSNTGKEVELIKGGVGLRVLDARTKKVVLDRGNDAIWESTIHESHNMETLQRFPIGKLKRLHAKYKAKGTKEASREASVIKRMIASKMNEAVSTNDPNRGRMGRKKPLVPQGMMPDETINPRTGNPVRTFGKLHSRMDQLSPETRKRYRQNYGYRTRVAGRGKRLYPLPEENTQGKKDRYEGQESTKSMIARLVASRHRKLGMKVPADVERDIDPKYKNKED